MSDFRLDGHAIGLFKLFQASHTSSVAVAGAHVAPTLFSLVETCMHHNIESYDWFRYILQEMPLCQNEKKLKHCCRSTLIMN